MKINKCPVCSKDLELKQINLDIAIEICVDLTCSYPVGTKCRLFKRKLEDINKDPVGILEEVQKNSTEVNEANNDNSDDNFIKDLDNFLCNVFEDSVEDTKHNSTNSSQDESAPTEPDLDLNAIFNELNSITS